MRYGIAGDSVDAGGDVDALDAVDVAQFLRGDLAGRGFFAGDGGGESEDAAGADS